MDAELSAFPKGFMADHPKFRAADLAYTFLKAA